MEGLASFYCTSQVLHFLQSKGKTLHQQNDRGNSPLPSPFIIRILKEKFSTYNTGYFKKPQKEEKKTSPYGPKINYITPLPPSGALEES